MDIVKKIFLAILGLSFVVTGGYVYLDKTRPGTVLGVEEIKEKITDKLPPIEEIKEKLPLEKMPVLEAVESDSIKEAVESTSEQLEILAKKATEVKKHLTQVVKEVKKDEDTPLHEKTFEYGQYLYCQQVVKDYDTQ